MKHAPNPSKHQRSAEENTGDEVTCSGPSKKGVTAHATKDDGKSSQSSRENSTGHGGKESIIHDEKSKELSFLGAQDSSMDCAGGVFPVWCFTRQWLVPSIPTTGWEEGTPPYRK